MGNKIDHVLIHGRFFSDIINVRPYREGTSTLPEEALGIAAHEDSSYRIHTLIMETATATLEVMAPSNTIGIMRNASKQWLILQKLPKRHNKTELVQLQTE